MKKDYYIFTSGELKQQNYNLVLIGTDGTKKVIPIESISNLFVYSVLHLNTTLFEYLGQIDINIHFFDYYSNYKGSFISKNAQHSGNTHVKQAQCYLDDNKRLYLAKEFVRGAMFGIHKNMQDYNIVSQYDEYIKKLDSCSNVSEVMGVEGTFRKKYYDAFDYMFNRYKFEKRTKQPPKNEINALISFGNSMMYSYCLNAIKQTYLNSTISFLHEAGDRRHSLCLDISEIFKVNIVDKVILKVINKNIIKDEHFNKEDTFCYLNDKGRKIFVREMEDKLNSTFFHRKINKNTSYKNLIKLECYKLCKHILDDEVYVALKLDS